MDPRAFFSHPACTAQRHYEALRAFYHEGVSATEAAQKFGLSPAYFKKVRVEFAQGLREGHLPFFAEKKRGPKEPHTEEAVVQQIVALRKRNYSIADIKSVLDAEQSQVSLDTIDRILKAEGFAPLPKRTRQQRLAVMPPEKFSAPASEPLVLTDEQFLTETGAGPLVFLPVLEQLGIVKAIAACGFPATSQISDVQSVLAFLALKLTGGKRWSHDSRWNMDRALGLFAGLNVLPKATTLSTYSYRVTRQENRRLLERLSRIFRNALAEDGEFNLDFKAIPHWGDESVLERNWSGSRSKAIKSLLALIVQQPATGQLAYTNAEIKHRDQSEALFEFIDFWKQGRGSTPKLLIFDSKFTTYHHLSRLNLSPEGIKFLTLRRRGKKLIERTEAIPEDQWQRIHLPRAKGKSQRVRVHDGRCRLRHYEGEVREVILTEHGRNKPTFLITNDFAMDVRDVVHKYAHRWLVEQEIAEQILFFQLNHPASSIVVKVDFDLTLSLLAHNLYRVLAQHLPGFEQCTVDTINRKFLENGARVAIEGNTVTVHLKKKVHLPILFEVPWMKKTTRLSWMNLNIQYVSGTVS
jgi:transposase